MTRAAFLIGTVVAVLATQAACADVLVQSDGRRLTGEVEEVAFLTKGVRGVYGRRGVLFVHLADEGTDRVVLRSGMPREGRLISVRFRTSDGVLTIPRQQLRAIELTAQVARKEQGPPKEPNKETAPQKEVPPEELAARNKALGQCYALRNKHWDKAAEVKAEETRALKERYWPDCQRAVDAIAQIQQTIRRKEQAREDELRRWREERSREIRNSRRTDRRPRYIPRPTFNDGLDRDERALREAHASKLRLQRKIKGERAVISRRTSQRRKRVEAAYARMKASLQAGKTLTAEQMASNFQAALGEPVDGGKKEGRKKK